MANTAELSSVASAVEELTARITAMAEAALAVKDESAASELYEVERALRTATRRRCCSDEVGRRARSLVVGQYPHLFEKALGTKKDLNRIFVFVGSRFCN